MKTPSNPNIPVAPVGNAFRVYGKLFPFTGRADKQAARDAAEQFGAERQAVMRAQTGRELTNRELVTGKVELPAEPSAPRSLKKEPSGANPWAGRIADLETKYCAKESDRKQRDARLEVYRRKAAEWAAENIIAIALDTRNADPDLARARQHAADSLDNAQLDYGALPTTVEQRRQLKRLIDGDTASVGDYWTKVRELYGEAAPVKPAEGVATNLYEVAK